MNILTPLSRGAAAPAFAQHSLVRLVRALDTPDGVVPAGTLATVLEIFDGGAAYLVEFEGEHEPPEFVRADRLGAVEA